MEAVEALSLAANIIAVTEFGAKFITSAWRIWRSGKEAVEEIVALEALCQNLKDVSTRLEKDLSGTSFQVKSNKGLSDVATQASKMAQDILDSVQKIGVPLKRRKRDAVRTAFKIVWKEEELHALQQRLDSLTNNLVLNLAASVRVYAMESIDTQNTILREVRKIQMDMQQSKSLPSRKSESNNEGFGSIVIECLTQQTGPRRTYDVADSLRSGLFGAVYERQDTPTGKSTDIIVAPERKRKLYKSFLSHLYYDGMYDRAEGVTKAHASTFRWIFEEDHVSGFSEWLASMGQLYWITGKAGSGKSTLMKLVSQPQDANANNVLDPASKPRLIKYLQHWAEDKPLTVASFYFWAAGSKIQTSREGLYRTLLHQILNDHPDVIAKVFPERWEVLSLYDELSQPFTEQELRQGLLKVVQCLDFVAKVCLLVDGLDEFDGKHDELISLFNDMIGKTSVKICVASRPWTVFEDAFRTKPSLRLEVLTYEDIKGYVTSRFFEDDHFVRLQKREPQFADTLIENVVRKASGVFLWVNLVVTSLIDGMQAGDRVSDLQRRLDLLPPDLEDLYDSILNSLDESYFEHAAQYFSLVRSSPEPPSAVVFYFADELEPEDPTFTLKALSFKDITPELMATKVDALKRRLHSRCKGLIEIEVSPQHTNPTEDQYDWLTSLGPKVQYLHKSVMDYVQKPNVEERLLSSMKAPFDSHLRFAAANIAVCEMSSAHGFCVDAAMIPDLALNSGKWALLHAKDTDPEYVKHTSRLLDYFDRMVSRNATLMHLLHFDHVAVGLSDFQSFGHSFISLVIKYGVTNYIKDRVLDGQLDQVQFHAPDHCTACLLSKAEPNRLAVHKRLLKGFRTKQTVSQKSHTKALSLLLREQIPGARTLGWDPDLVQLLLERGADPNMKFSPCPRHGSSAWVTTLVWIILSVCLLGRQPQYSLRSGWLEATELMIHHGADIKRKAILDALELVGEFKRFSISGQSRKAKEIGMLEQELRQCQETGKKLNLDFLQGLDLSRDRNPIKRKSVLRMHPLFRR